MEMPFLLHCFFIFAIGLCFGSFITLASWRLPRGQEIVKTPSRCTHCSARLRILDLWPVLSWVKSKGRCRYCGAGISARYPLIEMVSGGLLLGPFLRYGWSVDFALLAAAGICLLILIVVDLEHYIIPDIIQIALLVIGLGWRFHGDAEISDVLLGFVAGVAIGLALMLGFKRVTGRDGLGMGDVKFLGVAGLWLGPAPLVPFLFLSGILGIATATLWRLAGRGAVFPFGPALALSFFLCLLFPILPDSFWRIGEGVNRLFF